MKHRVTNFGSEPLTVKVPLADDVEVQPRESWVGEIDVIHHGLGRTHYSVRPAERLPISTELPVIDEDEE